MPGRNWRNLKTVALVTLLAAANIGFHAEVYFNGAPDYSVRVAIAAIIGLIMLVGGRLVPSFTRNWLVRAGCRTASGVVRPLRHRVDRWSPAQRWRSGWRRRLSSWSGMALLAAGVLQAVRLSRWAGLPTWREPLVLVLHCGYAFVPLGFLLVGLSVLWPDAIPASGALHAWTAGAMALMTLAVMTRASLGHTGYPLTASITTCVVYVAAIVAAFSRIAASLLPDLTLDLLSLAAVSWLVAFGGFVISYGPKLLRASMSS